MMRGINIAVSGMVTEMRKVDMISQNLANASTASYKRMRGVSGSFGDYFHRYQEELGNRDVITDGAMPSSGSHMELGWQAFQQGPLRLTNSDLNAAIDGQGFFVVETPAGERYTRAGDFRVNPDGWLVSAEGYRVLGPDGPLRIAGGSAAIGKEGVVTVDGEAVGRVGVVNFANANGLMREGGSMYRSTGSSGRATPVEPKLSPGFLEESNVNAMQEMAELINATRTYELNQKMIWAQDEALGKAVNEVGRVGQ